MTNQTDLKKLAEQTPSSMNSFDDIVYLNCIVVKVRQDKQIINKAIYLALP
jgi:transposase-like protein